MHISYELESLDSEGKYKAVILKMNRRKKKNALNYSMLRELNSNLNCFSQQPDIRTIIITGYDNIFSSGADLNYLYRIRGDRKKAKKFSKFGQNVYDKISKSDKPVIAAINGYALGGGLELAMACDIRIAVDLTDKNGGREKFIGLPELERDIIPSWGGPTRLSRTVGRGKTMEMVLTGELMDAEEAYRIGLVEKYVDNSDDLMAKCLDISMKIAESSEYVVKMAKKQIRKGLEMKLKGSFKEETKCFGDVFKNDNQMTGIKEFLEKE